MVDARQGPAGSYGDYNWPREAIYDPSMGQLDPALTGGPPGSSYSNQQHQPSEQLGQSSDLSTRGTGSPNLPFDSGASSGQANGKRTGSIRVTSQSQSSSRKKARVSDKDDDAIEIDPALVEREEKSKPTRGARACTVCRRLKMKCVGADNPPCKRCLTGNHQCVFEESNRGKRTSSQQVKKHELLTRSLRKMERTLDTVLKSISTQPTTNPPGLDAVSEHSTPKGKAAATQALIASPPSIPVSSSTYTVNRSPKLHSLPDNALNPLGLLAEASLANRKVMNVNGRSTPGNGASVNNSTSQSVGVANDGYFKPGPMTILPLRRLFIERQAQPEMLTFVSTEEVKELFNIYFTHLNPHCCLLIPEFHTPSLVCSRSPFLLTTICAISAKFHSLKLDISAKLNNIAKQLSFSVLEKGYKSVEIVQAYLLLTLWGAGHTENYETEKTWILLGMAIRVATDLNLHRKTAVMSNDTPEGKAREREVRNRERTWLLCFCLDRSLSAQMGKPHSIKEDNIVRNAGQWWQAASAEPADAGLVAYVDFQRILSRSLDFLYSGTSSFSGLQVDCDYLVVTRTIETQLQSWHGDWKRHWQKASAVAPATAAYASVISNFYFNYALLVVNSFGLQNAMDKSAVDVGHFFARCHTAASTCAIIARDELGPRGYLRYSPDSHFVQLSYAVLTLLKLIRPEFRPYMENEQRTTSLVADIATLLGEVAVGSQHTPALYGAFLKALISVKAAASRAGSPSINHYAQLTTSEAKDSTEQDSAFAKDMQQADESNGPGQTFTGLDPSLQMQSFRTIGEMGPVADLSIFPPTMLPSQPAENETAATLSMDSILSPSFWDNVLIPGFSNSFEGLSGGIVYGSAGSGLITPRVGSPSPSMQTGQSLQASADGALDYVFR